MLATSSIKDIIQPTCKPSEVDILNKFIDLLETYKINYTVIGGQPHFVVSNLAKSKGISSVDFSKNYFDKNKKCILGGVFKKIQGDDLVKFKQAWVRDNFFQFNKATSLWICDFVGAFNYLTIGYGEQAKDFKELGANSIETVITNATNKVTPLHSNQPYFTVNDSEETLHNAICALSSYTNRHFKREQIIVNSLADGFENVAKTRRFDLVEKSGRYVRVMELKAHPLTTDHIKEAVGDKGYLELAIAKYPKKRVKLVFVAPDITYSAKRLLKQMTKVEFISLNTLVSELVDEVKTEFKTADSEWYFTKHILPQFSNVLPMKVLSAA